MIEVSVRLHRGAFRLEIDVASEARIVGLFGPSGAGKSTVLDLLAGLVRPDEGRIIVNGDVLVHTARGVFVPTHRRRIGVVFQDALLFPHLNVRQNLAFGQWFTPRRHRRIGAGPIIDTLGIGHLLERRPRSLSGGERQRVGLARALVASPRLILMDEPLAALDSVRRFEILRLIERLRDATDIPIVYVSHAVEEISQIADDVIAIENGRVVAHGPPPTAFAAARHLVESRRFGLSSPMSCRVESYDPTYHLTRLAHPGGFVILAGEVGPPGRTVRLLVRATDVSLARTRPAGVSIRTMLGGTVATIEADTSGALAMVSVRLSGGDMLTAAVTRLAADELSLAPGRDVVCLVKSVALDERPLLAP